MTNKRLVLSLSLKAVLKTAFIFILLCSSALLVAQSSGDEGSIEKGGEAMTNDESKPKVEGKAEGRTESAEKKNKPVLSADDEFKPSEEVSEDLSVAFPVDI